RLPPPRIFCSLPDTTLFRSSRFREPTEPQQRAWPLIQAGRNALIAAPTGSGKTFAAFLAAIDSLLRQGGRGGDARRRDAGGVRLDRKSTRLNSSHQINSYAV